MSVRYLRDASRILRVGNVLIYAYALAYLGLAACVSSEKLSEQATLCSATDKNSQPTDFSLGTVKTEIDIYFQNNIPLYHGCLELYPADMFYGHTAPKLQRTNDTERVQKALFNASQIDQDDDGRSDGGVLYLRGSKDGKQNKYRLSRLIVPSNIRIIVDPEVTLVMIGGDVPRRYVDGSLIKDGEGKIKFRNNQHLFTIGNSEFTHSLNPTPIQNVEITSSQPDRRFTIDQRSEFPRIYHYRERGQLRDNGIRVKQENPQEYGVTATFAAPFFIGFAENIAISNVSVLDNYTYLPAIAIYPDSDMRDGIINARRHMGKPKTDANGHQLKPGTLIDAAGNKVLDATGYERNSTYGRTLTKGAFINIKSDQAHGGFGLLQLWAGNRIYMKNLHGTGGITVRLEPGAGIENISRAGPGLGDIHNVEIENISIRNGYTALWLKPHSKENHTIRARDVFAYDSGSAIILDKTSQNSQAYPDLYSGKFSNVKISGNIHFARDSKAPLAEVGYIPTLAMHPKTIAIIQDVDGYNKEGLRSGKPDGKISINDLPAGPSGNRWFLVDPIVPIISFNRMAADNLGRRDKDGDGEFDSPEDDSVFYDVDLTKAKITRGGRLPVNHSEDIVYRSQMRRLSDAKAATDMINK